MFQFFLSLSSGGPMVATRTWIGSAAPIAQVVSYAFAGTWIVGETITIAYGLKTWTYTTTSTSISTIIAGLVAAYNALSATSYPEFREQTAAGAATPMTLTARTPGQEFIAVVSTNSGSGTITPTTTQANYGPNDWSSAENWSDATVPANGDTAIIDRIGVQIYYGMDQSAVTLAELRINTPLADQTFKLGLPKTNTGGYAEYRPDYLKIGATLCNVATAGGRTKINFGSVQTGCHILNAGNTSEQGIPSVLLLGTHASNAFEILRGFVGICFFGGEVSTYTALNQGKLTSNNDSVVVCGSGCTIGTITKTAGTLTINSAVATALTCGGGSTTINGTGAVAQLTATGDLVTYSTSGTLGGNSVLSGGSLLDFSQDLTTKTVSNPITIYDSSDFNDPNQVVTDGITARKVVLVYMKTGRGGLGVNGYTVTRT